MITLLTYFVVAVAIAPELLLTSAVAPPVFVAMVAAPSVSLAAAPEKHEGKVISAADGKLVIADENGEDQEFEVNAKTKITRNQKEAELDDLQEGDLVKIQSQRKGTVLVATVIEARAPE